MAPQEPPHTPAFLAPHVVRALRRSRARRAALLALDELGSAYLGQLAAASGVRAASLRMALEGGLPGYKPESAAIALALATFRDGPVGRIYTITDGGRRAAAALRASLAAPLAARAFAV